MRNNTYVCFDCRTTERVQAARIAKRCRLCGKPAVHVFYKFRIPRKDDDKGWDDLRRRTSQFNTAAKARALERLTKDQAKFQELLSLAPDENQAKRESLAKRIRQIDKQIRDWQEW